MRTNLNLITFKLQMIFMVLFLTGTLVHAQKTKPISLEEALNKASQNNATIKIAEKDFDIIKAVYNQTAASFLPKVSITNTSSMTNSPLNAFGFKLLQQSITMADFNPAVLNNPAEIKNFNTSIQLQQPLLNFDAFQQRKAVKSQVEATQFISERTKEGIAFKVKTTYLQLQVAYKSVQVLQNALKTTEANKAFADNLFKQGLIQNADVLRVAVRQAEVENQLQNAQSTVINISNTLAYLLNIKDSGLLKPADSLNVLVDNQGLTKHLNTNRHDILAFQSQIQSQEHMLKASKFKFLPRANAFSNYEWNTSQFLGTKANNYFIGLQLRWDIFNGGQNVNKVIQQKETLNQYQLKYNDYLAQSKVDVDKAKQNLIDAKSNISRAKTEMTLSKDVLRITTNRFKQGLEKATDLLNAETQYQMKQLNYYQAIFKYNIASYYLTYLLK